MTNGADVSAAIERLREARTELEKLRETFEPRVKAFVEELESEFGVTFSAVYALRDGKDDALDIEVSFKDEYPLSGEEPQQ